MTFAHRLLIASTPLVIWAVVYIIVRSGVTDLLRLGPVLKAGYYLCLPAWAISMVFDRNHVADMAMGVFWGFFGSQVWIERRRMATGAKGQ
jgi:hypothetical protein